MFFVDSLRLSQQRFSHVQTGLPRLNKITCLTQEPLISIKTAAIDLNARILPLSHHALLLTAVAWTWLGSIG